VPAGAAGQNTGGEASDADIAALVRRVDAALGDDGQLL